MICLSRYSLVLCLSLLWLYAQADVIVLDTLPLSEQIKTEVSYYEREELDTKNTYNDFDKKEKEDEYLVYSNSPVKYFMGTDLWHDLHFDLIAEDLPALVEGYSISVLPRSGLSTFFLGVYNLKSKAYLQCQYFNRDLEEQIFAQTTTGSAYAVRRAFNLRAYSITQGFNFNIIKLGKQFYLVGAIGLELSWTRVRFAETTRFQFENRESLEAILGNSVDINFDDNRVGVNVEQDVQIVRGNTVSPFWQIGFEYPVNDQFTLNLKANNLIPVNLYFKVVDAFLVSSDQEWDQNFRLQYESSELKNRAVQLSLSYRISEAKRSKRQLKLD